MKESYALVSCLYDFSPEQKTLVISHVSYWVSAQILPSRSELRSVTVILLLVKGLCLYLKDHETSSSILQSWRVFTLFPCETLEGYKKNLLHVPLRKLTAYNCPRNRWRSILLTFDLLVSISVFFFIYNISFTSNTISPKFTALLSSQIWLVRRCSLIFYNSSSDSNAGYKS